MDVECIRPGVNPMVARVIENRRGPETKGPGEPPFEAYESSTAAVLQQETGRIGWRF